MPRTVAALVVVVVVAACNGEDTPWVGKYAATGTWDISGPLAGNRTVGDAVADLLVDEIVKLTGVPSALEDKTHEFVGKAIRDHVKSVVDGNAPAELAPGGSVTKVLAASLADVTATSSIELEEGLLPGSMKGRETVTSVAYRHEGKAYTLDASELAGAGVSIVADWEGDEEGDRTLEVDPHGVKIRYGELVSKVASHVVDAAGQGSLRSQVESALACDQIVTLVLGGGQGLKISVSDWSYSVGESDLKGACSSAAALLKDRALGLFALDSLLEVGGKVTWVEEGGKASELRSAAGFGGIVKVAPPALAPRVTVSFKATRD
jgi:hypothetical protein